MNRRPSSARAAFTLIELLTVIAIVGILAAILIPTVAKARALAHQAACQSNLRQWGVALQLYANDNKQKIPYEGSEDDMVWGEAANPSEGNAWFNILPPYANYTAFKDMKTGIGGMNNQAKAAYFKDKGRIYICGADERPLHPLYMNPSYMINSQLYESHSPIGKGGPDQQLTLNHLKQKALAPLSQIAFMADAGTANPPGNDSSRPRLRGHEDGQYGMDYRHGGGFNVVFIDASVRRFPKASLDRTGRNAPTPGLVWNPWTEPFIP